mgnify:CR=1 FL=1
MRNRTWSDLIIVAMIALCAGTVATPEIPQAPAAVDGSSSVSIDDHTNLAVAAQSLAVAVMLTGERASDLAAVEESRVAAVTDRAMTQAAEAAGAAASGIEMPFFSFGGDTSAE